MIKGAEPISSADFNKGLVTRSDFLKGDINASPNTMDVQWNFDASLHKRLGHSSTNSVVIGSTAVAGWIIDSATSLTTNLQAYWKLEEPSGSRFDQLGTNILASKNNVTSIVGIRGQAALFAAGNSQSLIIATTGPLETGNINFTMAGWIYLATTSATQERVFISKRDAIADSFTKLLLHCDGTNLVGNFTDVSTFANTITANSGATVSSTQFKFGGGSYRSARDGRFLSTPDNAIFAFGASDFTIDFWVYLTNTSDSTFLAQYQDSNSDRAFLCDFTAAGQLRFSYSTDGTSATQSTLQNAWTPTINTWNHIAYVRNGSSLYFFVNGAVLGSPQNVSTDSIFDSTLNLTIGTYANPAPQAAFATSGFFDEIRISNGTARWVAAFTPPTNPYPPNDYEYYLYLNTDNVMTFRVSSLGTVQSGSVRATSAGALSVGSWYNVVAWHSNNSHLGISVNLSTTTAAYTTGVRVGSAPFMLGAISNDGINAMDGRIDETSFWQNRILTATDRANLYGGGSGNTYTTGQSNFSWASFDFGASSIRWLTIAAGTGLYASSNLGTTFVVIGTTRTQNYQSLTRSKNVLIATSDSYDVPLYWAGSAGTFANTLAPNSAPAAKFAQNYQGFLILLNFMNSNNVIRNRGFAYADENLQLTDTWQSSFDIPSSADDEITASFILYKFLYISTRFTIFRVAFTGGNPDWSYLKVKDWGFVPRTVQIVSLKGGGQVAIGLDWNRRLRAFDGFDDMFISDNIENDNGICDFAMNKVSYAGSGLVISHAILNTVKQEYRLNVAIGPSSTQTTHGILLNARNLAFYPYSNQLWQTMCMAQSNNQSYLMAADRSGFVYVLDSGNLDVITPINEVYDTPPLFSKLPEAVSKGKQLNLFFAPKSSGTLYYQERYNLSNTWSDVNRLTDKNGVSEMTGTENLLKLTRTIDVKATYNTIQFRLTSSGNTANPWELDRLDFLQQGFGIGQG